MSFLLKTVSSQFKHPAGRKEVDLNSVEISKASALRNEPFSFQVLYRAETKSRPCHPVSISILGENIEIETYRVDQVPITQAANLFNEEGYEGNEPGLYPDILSQRPAVPQIESIQNATELSHFEIGVSNLLNALSNDLQSLWVTLNPNAKLIEAKTYRIEIRMTSLLSGEILEEAEFCFEVIDALLPKSNVYYTNWIYEDAICDTFGVELYGKEFYRIFDDYLRNAAKHGQNTLLLPAFTPPLDTSIGKERRNVQLTDVRLKNGAWDFGFDRMKEFIDHAKNCGILFFEHSHLFSQWGAEHAPNIYDTENNRIFGAETDATGEEYQTFLHAYLKAFLAFAKKEKIDNNLIFHISDEPSLSHLPAYEKAMHSVAEQLEHYPIADALSNVEFYEKGLVKQPVTAIDRSDEFYRSGASFWVYYTGGPHHKKASNRLITNTAGRTRVLGLQMYKYKALGFLHWGYNYCYDRLTNGTFDPRSNPCGYKQYPGVAHLAYPTYGNPGCYVASSVREKHMQEAFLDLRALNLLESMIGREKTIFLCEEILKEPIDCRTIPRGNELFSLREKINAEIKKYI